MAEEIQKSNPAQETADKASRRKAAIKAYHDAETKEAKKAAVKQYPELAEIYSSINHS